MVKDGMEKDITILANLFLKSKMKKEIWKNILMVVYYYLKDNILMEKKVEKVKNMTNL